MALRDVIALFRVNIEGVNQLDDADKRLKRISKDAEKAERDIIRFGKAFIGGVVLRGIKNFVQGQIQMADELKHNAENLGLTTDELQKYQFIASAMQVPTQQAVVAFRFFNRAVGEVAMGTKSTTKYFQQMGIKIYDAQGKIKPTDQLLFEFSDKLAAIPDQSLRTAYAMRALGRGGASMLPVLQKGSAALREMFRDVEELGGGFDADFVEKAHEVDLEEKRLAMGWRTMSAILIKQLIPYMKMWIDNGIKNVKLLIDTAKHSYAVASAIRFLGAVAVAAGAAVALAWGPEIAVFTALAAAVFAAYLIFDDFYTFLKGGKSVIGDNIDKMGGDSKNVAKQIKDAFKGIYDAVKPVSDSMKEFSKSFSGAAVADIIKWSGTFTVYVVDVFDSLLMILRKLAAYGNVSAIDLLTNSKAAQAAEAKVNAIEAAYEKRHAAYQGAVRALDSLGTPTVQSGNKTNPDGSPALPAPPAPAPSGVNPDGSLAGLPPPPLPSPNIVVNVQSNGHDPSAVGRAAAKGAAAGMRNAYAGVTAGMPSAVGNN
jgi:hypothetical protein